MQVNWFVTRISFGFFALDYNLISKCTATHWKQDSSRISTRSQLKRANNRANKRERVSATVGECSRWRCRVGGNRREWWISTERAFHTLYTHLLIYQCEISLFQLKAHTQNNNNYYFSLKFKAKRTQRTKQCAPNESNPTTTTGRRATVDVWCCFVTQRGVRLSLHATPQYQRQWQRQRRDAAVDGSLTQPISSRIGWPT